MSFLNTSYRSYSGHTIEVHMSFGQVRALYRAIRSPQFMHARTRYWCYCDVTSIYHRNPKSPSGVLLEAGGPDCVVAAILRRCRPRTSPLSPTEGLRR